MARSDFIETMLVCSTGNLMQATCDAATDGELLVMTIPHEYGFIVHVPDDDEITLPDDLAAAFVEARKVGCTWINFDRDANAYPGLTYREA